MFPLPTEFSFAEITEEETPILKVTLLLLEFPLAKLSGESNDHFLARVELDAENVLTLPMVVWSTMRAF
jgi:hypothetical protein